MRQAPQGGRGACALGHYLTQQETHARKQVSDSKSDTPV